MESVLHGKWGEVTYEVDANNRIVRQLSYEAPVNGEDVQLSIDMRCSSTPSGCCRPSSPSSGCSPAKNPEVDKPDGVTRGPLNPNLAVGTEVHYPAPAGSMVVMNNPTGAIMAMASYPTFDNRWFSADVPDGEVRPDLPDHGTRRVAARPRQGGAHEPGDPGPVQRRLDVQAVHRLRRAGHRAAVAATTIFNDQGTYQLSNASIKEDRCAAGRALRVPQLDVPARQHPVPVRRR